MHRAKRWVGFIVGIVLGVLIVDLAAQMIEFNDGTYGTKAVIYNLDGVQVELESHLAAIETAIEALQADVAAGSTQEWYLSVGTTEDENEIDANSGVLMGISAYNNHASANAFLKCTNATAANTTPGTTAIFYQVMIPWGGGIVEHDINATYSTALTCFIVLGEAANDVAEVAANDVGYNITTR